jgi:hypothetical protein
MTTPRKKAGARKKAPAKKKAGVRGKVPNMKDVLAQHTKVEKAKRLMDLSREQAAARKKEWEGAVADLSALLKEIKAGQTRLAF